MYRRFVRRSAVIAVMVLVACQSANTPVSGTYDPVPTVVDTGLAYGQPCSPPCWQGLTPGKSTSADVAKAIDQVKASSWAKSVVRFPGGGFLAQPTTRSYEGAVTATVDEGVVTHISGNLLFYYSIGEMIQQFGEPEGLYLISQGQVNKDACTEYADKEDLRRYVNSIGFAVLYPSLGMFFVAEAPAVDGGLICPDMRIVRFCYYAPQPIQKAIEDDQLMEQCGLESLKNITTTDLVKWHGFGSGY